MGLTRAQRERIGDVSQIGQTQLVSMEEGAERGVRVIEFRTGSGLDFGVMVDRGFDIGWCRWRGRSLAWHSPTGFVGPWYREVDGLGFLRSFGGGLFTTSGLDHILFPEEDPNDTYNYPGRQSASYGLHGRLSNTPARIVEHGLVEENGVPVLTATGRVSQAGALEEHLVLERKVSVGLVGQHIEWFDRVTNEGFYPTPHMYLYHMNFGSPLLSPTCELIAPIEEVTFRTESAAGSDGDYLQFHEPRTGFVEQVFGHRMRSRADGRVKVALINHDDAQRPWGMVLSYDGFRFPYFFQWRYLDAGRYVTGLEPSTNGLSGRQGARDAKEMKILDPGESVEYRTSLEVVEGLEHIEAIREEIGEGE